MNDLLVDTQALIWFADGSQKLSVTARARVEDLVVRRFVSAATIWEMAIKIPLGKLTLRAGTLSGFVQMLKSNGFDLLPITADDAVAVSDLPAGTHKDPFDRLIAAQCLRLDLTLITVDAAFDTYGVRRVW
jgi:PIN domain nuclease of toxin-antitoxin system